MAVTASHLGFSIIFPAYCDEFLGLGVGKGHSAKASEARLWGPDSVTVNRGWWSWFSYHLGVPLPMFICSRMAWLPCLGLSFILSGCDDIHSSVGSIKVQPCLRK